MTTWHVLLYSAAAVLALRSFIQLVAGYRSDREHAAVKDQLTKMTEEIEADSQRHEPVSPHEAIKKTTPARDHAAAGNALSR